ncbi:hypothetical protein BT96DRAFT_1025600 [Gymnopus androsaceus JB14]|uniref:Uncharacterized protein n=1 Tax=Gymnopus androsaceus JB14 TaxID=1447944 RepID=A0A6A4GRT1_9AGAR|nr:hypothetical protein BT96DRAFT_1025600 [Gymnopus androsaceus JB14]
MLIPDAVDKKNVSAVLEKKNSSWEKALATQPDWVWKRCRRYVPSKDILYRNLKELFDCWGPVKCSKTGQTLFDQETWKKANAVLHDTKLGWLSDPDDVPLYVLEGDPDQNGLNIYHCLRGTNSVEGSVHNPIHKMFGSLNASPELADALVADWRHRHNVDAGSKHKLNVKYTGHYDPWLDFALQKLKGDILWSSSPSYPVWDMISDTNPLGFSLTEEKFGIPKIPPVVRLNADFQPYDGVSHSLKDSDMLVLTHLRGKQRDIYIFLAEAQDIKFAVTPFHTEQEFECFHNAVSAGDHVSHVLAAATRTKPGVRLHPIQDDMMVIDVPDQAPVSEEDIVMAPSPDEVQIQIPQDSSNMVSIPSSLPVLMSNASQMPILQSQSQFNFTGSGDFSGRSLSALPASAAGSSQQSQFSFTHGIHGGSISVPQSSQNYSVWKTLPPGQSPLTFTHMDQSDHANFGKMSKRKCRMCQQTDCPGSQNRLKCKNKPQQ